MRLSSPFLLAILLSSFLLLAGCALFPNGLPTTPGSVPPGGFNATAPPPSNTSVPSTPTPPSPPPNSSANASANASNSSSNFTNAIINASNSTLPLNRTNATAAPSGLELLFIDVGFADATLVRTNNFTMLIDTGSAESASALVDTLRTVGVTRIDLLVLSTFSSDKTGGLPDVLHRFPVQSAWHDGAVPNSPQFTDAVAQLSGADIPILLPEAGQTYSYGPLNLRVYNPQHVRYGNNPQSDSIVLRVSDGAFCAFLPSDISDEQEPQILGQLNSSSCPVYKWRYHGQGKETPSLLYNRLASPTVVISTGSNDEGLPSPTTLERLRLANARVLRTDLNGSIYINASANGSYDLQTHADLAAIGHWYNWTYPSINPLADSGN